MEAGDVKDVLIVTAVVLALLFLAVVFTEIRGGPDDF